MPCDTTIDALNAVATAVTELLTQLRSERDSDERAALTAALEARLDGLQADLRLRHGLTERAAAVVVARALIRVGEIVRDAPPHLSGAGHPGRC